MKARVTVTLKSGVLDPQGKAIEGALRSLDIHLEPEVLSRLDRIFPGPGGPAPEAYAW